MEPVWSAQISSPKGPTHAFLAAGDFCLPEIPALKDRSAAAKIFAPEVLSFLHAKDLSSVGVEFPLAAGGTPIVKSGPNLRGSSSTIEALTAARFDAVTLANNHMLDFGPRPLLDTVGMLRQAGFQTVGAGASEADAGRPLFLTCGGIRVSVLGFAEQEFNSAGPESAGVARLSLVDAARRIREARKNADVVIVLVHGGAEFYPLPSSGGQDCYRFLVECGAHAVLGHHPHSIQGAEVYQGAPIVYSSGNFWLWYPSPRQPPACWHFGLVTKLTISGAGVHAVACHGVRTGETGGLPYIRGLDDGEQKQITARMSRLGGIVADAPAVRRFWECLCHERRAAYMTELAGAAAILPLSPSYLTKAGIRRIAPHCLGLAATNLLGRLMAGRRTRQREAATACNLIRCPTHHEAMVTILEMELAGAEPSTSAWAEYRELMTNG